MEYDTHISVFTDLLTRAGIRSFAEMVDADSLEGALQQPLAVVPRDWRRRFRAERYGREPDVLLLESYTPVPGSYDELHNDGFSSVPPAFSIRSDAVVHLLRYKDAQFSFISSHRTQHDVMVATSGVFDGVAFARYAGFPLVTAAAVPYVVTPSSTETI